GVVSNDTLKETLADVADVDECADRLIQLALRGGAHDNVTLIVADVVALDDLPDGAGPSTARAVVGSAATIRTPPTVAQDGPAARAARLTRRAPADDGAELVEEPDPPRRTWLRVLTWLAALAVLGGIVWGGYAWTQTQYFVGVHEGNVTVFQGIPQRVGTFELSTPVEITDVAAADLPDNVRERVEQTIAATSLANAREIAANAAAAAPRSTPTRTVPPPPPRPPRRARAPRTPRQQHPARPRPAPRPRRPRRRAPRRAGPSPPGPRSGPSRAAPRARRPADGDGRRALGASPPGRRARAARDRRAARRGRLRDHRPDRDARDPREHPQLLPGPGRARARQPLRAALACPVRRPRDPARRDRA